MIKQFFQGIRSAMLGVASAFCISCGSSPQHDSLTTSTVVMVPPEGFRHNEQTAASNAFQHAAALDDAGTRAMHEFEQAVAELRRNHVNVLLLNQDKSLPDAVFPNNWFTTFINASGKTDVYIYPMLTENRRAEVNIDKLKQLLADNKISVERIHDLRHGTSKVLEGTGSLIFDKPNKLIYAALSERTDPDLVKELANKLGYQTVIFHADDAKGFPIYHTNVIMGLADDFAVICLECIRDAKERAQVVETLQKSGKKIIDISLAQVGEMCGNVLALKGGQGEKLLLMSTRAKNHFTREQLADIEKHCKIVAIQIDTIEQIGGGSARCMVAEIFHQ